MTASTFVTNLRGDANAPLLEKPTRLLIGGTWQDSSSKATFAAFDPATGAVLGDVADASPSDVDAAVAAARSALDGAEWAQLSPAARARLLWRLADLIDTAKAQKRIATTDESILVGRVIFAIYQAEIREWLSDETSEPEIETGLASLHRALHLLVTGLKPRDRTR